MSAVARSGKWRVKPSGKLPIFLRFIINSSFTEENAEKSDIKTVLENRTFLNHMMYWKASEYDQFENEIVNHLKKNDGWFERYYKQQIAWAEFLYSKGNKLKKINWNKKSNQEIKKELEILIKEYNKVCCSWYAQYPLDEFFEKTIEQHLETYVSPTDHNFRKYVLIFTDPNKATEVSQERTNLVRLLKKFIANKENFSHLSSKAEKDIQKHLRKFAYINRGLATSKAYNFQDIVNRLKEMHKLVKSGESLKKMAYDASEKKTADEYEDALARIKPKADFKKIIEQARAHSYMRNRRVEAFFNADFGASFIYDQVAKRNKFNEDWIMEVTTDEMFGALDGKPLPSKEEIKKRMHDYAMIVKKAKTKLVSNPEEIEKLKKRYFVKVSKVEEIKGKVACMGEIVKGKAKICLDKSEINKVKKGNVLVAIFTTPDFVPAMEKAVAIVADQGGVSSHAAIVSRELGIPCVIDTKNATRVIHDNDLVEVNAKTGLIRVLKRYEK